ncbi:hypothetical protein RCC89_18795 [Cytophagaceae bacterium ABcell3]|nr:hypothetical protein RCC89_18795 [Cytophagaceae bacterium ABcell3]
MKPGFFKKYILLFLLIVGASMFPTKNYAQNHFNEVVIKTDTSEYLFSKNAITYMHEKHFAFRAESEKPVLEITIYPDSVYNFNEIHLLNSPDFSIVDSMLFIDDKFFRGKIKLHNTNNTDFPHLLFQVHTEKKVLIKEIKLLPYYEPVVYIKEEETQLFQDEEKSIQLHGKNLFNLKTNDTWIEESSYDHRIVKTDGNYFLQIKPKTTGIKFFSHKLRTIRPYVNEHSLLSYNLDPLSLKLHVLPSRIDFLNTDRSYIYLDISHKSGEEIQLDNNKNLQLKKTYRLEDQEERGGRLIAELFTVSQIANTDKVLCRVKPYALHRVEDGYLYIKDGDKNRFITNFNIVEKPRIDKIHIMHEGQDWTNNLSVNPGENIEVRIEGTGLKNSSLQFDGLPIIHPDSTRLSDETLFYKFKIPVDISKRKVSLFMNKKVTPYELLIKEYQQPSDFDFVYINYDGNNIPLNNQKLDKPIFIQDALKDINLTFDGNKIDKDNKLYGKQYINIEIRVMDNRNQLVDYQTINNIVVCPGEASPRFSYYDTKDCRFKTISLNDYLMQKTYNLEAFTQLQISVSHNEPKQGAVGYTRKVKFIMTRSIHFDMQVSFPAGLLVKKFNQQGIGNLSGISTAVLAQLAFYDKERIGRLRPYKVGAGFIALNAFNFSEDPNVTRDIGIVVLGSLLPVRKDSKFSIPLYVGGGYLLKNNTWFLILGPGIQFNF